MLTEEGLTFFFREYTRLKRVLEKNNIADPEHALIRAAEHGRVHIVALLLEAEADINVRDQTNGTALIAACYNGHLEVVLELLAGKANPDLQDEGGHSALIFSCDKGHMEICISLIEAGAALNLQDRRGNSALLMAAYIGHIDVCHLLVERGEPMVVICVSVGQAICAQTAHIKESCYLSVYISRSLHGILYHTP